MAPNWTDILLSIVPIEIYREIRDDIIDIYQEAYQQIPDTRFDITSWSLSKLREETNEQGTKAKSYNPHQSVTDSVDFLSGIWKAAATILAFIFLVGAIFGLPGLIFISRRTLDQLVSPTGILIALMTGSTLFLSAVAAIIFLVVRLAYFNTFIVQALNSALLIGPEMVQTRNQSKLVGYYIWNSSLNGGKALYLLSIFAVLWILSALTPWNPYETIRVKVKDNIDVLTSVDTRREAVKAVFRRSAEQYEETPDADKQSSTR